MLQSQIACHAFLCLSQPRLLLNWLMETRDMPNELGFLCHFINCLIIYTVGQVYYCLGHRFNTI